MSAQNEIVSNTSLYITQTGKSLRTLETKMKELEGHLHNPVSITTFYENFIDIRQKLTHMLEPDLLKQEIDLANTHFKGQPHSPVAPNGLSHRDFGAIMTLQSAMYMYCFLLIDILYSARADSCYGSHSLIGQLLDYYKPDWYINPEKYAGPSNPFYADLLQKSEMVFDYEKHKDQLNTPDDFDRHGHLLFVPLKKEQSTLYKKIKRLLDDKVACLGYGMFNLSSNGQLSVILKDLSASGREVIQIYGLNFSPNQYPYLRSIGLSFNPKDHCFETSTAQASFETLAQQAGKTVNEQKIIVAPIENIEALGVMRLLMSYASYIYLENEDIFYINKSLDLRRKTDLAGDSDSDSLHKSALRPA